MAVVVIKQKTLILNIIIISISKVIIKLAMEC